MIRLVIRGPSEPVAAEFSRQIAGRLHAALQVEKVKARVLGPAPCPFARLRGNYRFQIQTQSSDSEKLRLAVNRATTDLQPPDEVQWIVDVDPVEML
jgi:primosomal protein N' (replication factor Y) (superfamily II helicase)